MGTFSVIVKPMDRLQQTPAVRTSSAGRGSPALHQVAGQELDVHRLGPVVVEQLPLRGHGVAAALAPGLTAQKQHSSLTI